MPMVGFGTYRFKDGAAGRATTEALRAGYRLIDTAFCYGGEKVGTLASSLSPRRLHGVTLSNGLLLVYMKAGRTLLS